MIDIFKDVAHQIASFEDDPSKAGRPTGSAKGGFSFEGLVAKGLNQVIGALRGLHGATPHSVLVGTLSPRKLKTNDGIFAISKDQRQIVFRMRNIISGETLTTPIVVKEQWLKRTYKVEEWYDGKIAELSSKGWIPEDGEVFSGHNYSKIHKGLTIEFDGTVLFIEKGALCWKVLLECKSAKSSKKGRIDGNAHERFAYQNLEYLELAALYPRTQLILLTNDAFVRYKNKYHTGFGVHGIRLSNAFAWYDFDMVSTASQYVRLFKRWHAWLEGK
ncbi:hypothetical protein [Meiothermus sp.]|uniref:hypothetical protein n=1 Tax=Meiothermus sp. TaxID=1955249 RepID=UPI00261F18D5|nr:hypothetical protein [Meiothermus sp.]